jgi:hypothetical protein
MTRGRGNMDIFPQIRLFSKVLVVWETGVGVLAVCGAKAAKHKICGNLGG